MVWYSMVGMEWYGVLWYSMVGMVWYGRGMVCYGMIRRGMLWNDLV